MAFTMASTDAPAIHCNIDVEHQSNIDVEHQSDRVSLRGRIVSVTATSGDYRLEIQSRSRSGSSDISQADTFSAEPNETVLVGFADMTMGTDTRLVARLKVARLKVQAADARACNIEREISAE